MPLGAKRILVPVAGEKFAEDAFRLACRVAKHNGARVYVLYVIELGLDLPLDAEPGPENEVAEAVLQRIEALGREEKCPVEASLVQARHAGPAIVQEAIQRNMELITLAESYKKRFGPQVLGEAVSYVLKNAPCPVLLWREPLPGGPFPGG